MKESNQEELVKPIKEHRKQLIKSNKVVDNESHKSFDELCYKKMNEINDLSIQIDFNNLNFYFKVKIISPINFIGFKASLQLNRYMFNGAIKLRKSEEDQKQFKVDLIEITTANHKKKSEDQTKTIKNIKNLYE